MRRDAEALGLPAPDEAGGDEVFVFPASFAQRRLWYLSQLNPSSVAYSVLAPFRISGPLDIPVLERTLNEIVRRHESLRTTFAAGDEPIQLVSLSRSISLLHTDLTRHRSPVEDVETAVMDWLRAEARRPFDLERGPLIRAAVLRLGVEEHVLAVSMHHIVSDGWSLGVLMREASELYGAYLAGRQSPLPELEIQYADYSLWQRDWLQGDVLDRQVAYWRKELEGVPTALELPVDRPRKAQQSQRGLQHAVRLGPELGQSLRLLGRRQGATLYMVLLAGLQALLTRYTGQQQLLIGSPIAGRTRRETEELIGFFVNTLVLRADLRGSPDFEQLLRRVKETTLGAFAHQDIPFEKLVEVLSPERDPSRSPLFQLMFILQNAPGGRLQLGPARLQPIAVDAGTAKFEITLSLEEQADGSIEGYWEYNSELFEPATIARIADHYTRLLAAALAAPQTPVATLDILSPQERQHLAGWNDTAVPCPDQCLHHLFEQQAKRTPDAVALTDLKGSLTYRELNARANQLARLLRTQDVGPEKRVAILMDSCPETIVAVLAILKAGGAYVPLDPGFPGDRIGYILQQSGALLVLTMTSSRSLVAGGIACIVLDSPDDPSRAYPAASLSGLATPANAAYVIYTSGSTGRPKGVVVEHRQALNYFHGIVRRLGLQAGANYAMLQPLAVDSCKTVLIPWMCLGGTLHVLPRSSAIDPEAIAEYFRRERMDVLKIAPSHLAELLEASSAATLLPQGQLVLGGEGSRWDWIRRSVLPRMSAAGRVHIHYGPTETTVGVLTHMVDPAERPRGPLVPLGSPLSNVAVYVVSPDMMQVPTGVTGEILIGGNTVARGYLDRPELTAERFLPDPFGKSPGSRLYRSGDLARRLPCGSIEFIGRADYQVKIRGFRIELGEIESALLEHPLVERAAALARENDRGDKSLKAYVLANRSAPKVDRSVLARKFREWLGSRLPNYMVPTTVVILDAWPLTAQGKLDLRALHGAAETEPQRSSTALPRNRTEAQLVSLWSDLLNTPSIGIHESFFELGGHSLMMVRMLSLVRQRLQHNVPPARFLERPSVAHLAELIAGDGGPAAPGLLVKLQPSGQNPPLFCVHPIGGQVACYAPLAMSLGTDRPFLAFQAPETGSAETIEEISECYLEELRRIAPSEPCCLGGWSFGGLIAFEMARQLAARGKPALRLVMFDSYPPRTGRDADGAQQASLIERFAADIALTLGRESAGLQAEFRAMDPEPQRRFLLRTLRQENLIDVDSDREFDNLLARFLRHSSAADCYGPYRIDQPIDLFIAAGGAGRNSLARRWSEWTTAGVQARLVDGDHYSMLRPPLVTGLAAQLAQCLPVSRPNATYKTV